MTEDFPLIENAPRHPTGGKWVAELYRNKSLDSVAETDFGQVVGDIIEGINPKDSLERYDKKADTDPNVFLKNKLLAKLGELADDPHRYTSDFLALLESQAETLDDQHQETRYRQFMGLLEIILATYNDRELRDLFEDRKQSLNEQIDPIDRSNT